MFRKVIGVEAAAIERFDDLQPLLIIVPQRQIVAVQMVENTEL